MQVNLRRSWFAPDGSLYKSEDNPHTFPDEWERQLPATAQIGKEVKVPSTEIVFDDTEK